MEERLYEEPWKHLIVRDVFPEKILNKILESRYNIPSIKAGSLFRYPICVDDNHIYYNNEARFKTVKNTYSLDSIMNLSDIRLVYDYIKPSMLGWFKLLKGKEIYKDYHVSIEIQLCSEGFEYKIHEDVEKKLLSVCVYLFPDIEEGTMLHRSFNQPPHNQVEWESNKAFVFARERGVTWHSYKSNSQERFTMNINIIKSSDEAFNVKGDVIHAKS